MISRFKRGTNPRFPMQTEVVRNTPSCTWSRRMHRLACDRSSSRGQSWGDTRKTASEKKNTDKISLIRLSQLVLIDNKEITWRFDHLMIWAAIHMTFKAILLLYDHYWLICVYFYLSRGILGETSETKLLLINFISEASDQ